MIIAKSVSKARSFLGDEHVAYHDFCDPHISIGDTPLLIDKPNPSVSGARM
jgi:hypothetical protein